jgi:hypothetical protein
VATLLWKRAAETRPWFVDRNPCWTAETRRASPRKPMRYGRSKWLLKGRMLTGSGNDRISSHRSRRPSGDLSCLPNGISSDLSVQHGFPAASQLDTQSQFATVQVAAFVAAVVR